MLRLWGKRPLLALAACVVTLAGVAVVRYGGSIATQASEAVAPGPSNLAEVGAAPTAVAALGRVEPQSEIINLGPGGLGGAPQDRLEALLVERGDTVVRGQVLGYLAGRAEQIAQRDMFRAQLDEARLRLKTETALDLQRIADATTRQRQILEVTPSKIAAQQAEVKALEAALADHQDVLTMNSRLFPLGVTSRRARDGEGALVRQGQAKLESARAHLFELERQFEFDKDTSGIQVKLAQATLERAQAEFPIASLEKQIELAEARARNLTLSAPVNGRILNILVKPGENVGVGAILIIGDTSKMRVVAEVYETDIHRVQVGQRATVASRALAEPLTGKVVRIGDLIFKNDVLNVDPAARVDARIVQVWIELDDGSLVERLTNLTVDVVIGDSTISPPEPKLARAVAQ